MSRTYNQGCMLAYALDNLGERWTLLIVRDLFLGPRGFVDLQTSLGIGGSLLSKRLKELEEMRLVTSETPDGKRNLYRLTPLGEQLRPTIRAMMRWSLRFMKETAGEAAFEKMRQAHEKPDSAALGLEMYAEHHRDPSLSYVAHLIISGHPYTVYYMSGEMIVRRDADAPAVARIETDIQTVFRGLRRELDAQEVRALSKAEGAPQVLAHLLQCIGSKRPAEKAA
ncbi:MAG: hypothetical protein Kow00133_14300 [Amphiplicatus sp.]